MDISVGKLSDLDSIGLLGVHDSVRSSKRQSRTSVNVNEITATYERLVNYCKQKQCTSRVCIRNQNQIQHK